MWARRAAALGLGGALFGGVLLGGLFVSGLFVSGTASAQLPSAGGQGSFRLLTYNVAGLPEGISASHPLTNLPLIGKLLGDYDLVLVQEDFAYPEELRRGLHLGYVSEGFVPGHGRGLGDGLSQFARWPFGELRREPWSSCNGIVDAYFDCLTPKGFSVSLQSLPGGARVRVYNLHLDAGREPGDQAARTAQVEQLLAALHRQSAEDAVILGGDTNLHGHDRPLFDHLLAAGSLQDACAALACPDPRRIDRVLFRSSPRLRLRPKHWAVARQFVDGAGAPLSDHLPVEVEFEWQAESAQPLTRQAHGSGLR
jgi:hypothetical protein